MVHQCKKFPSLCPWILSLSVSYWPKSKNTINPKPKSATSCMSASEQDCQQQLRCHTQSKRNLIASENPEKIRRSLLHSIRTFSDIKYITGDPIYYKSLDSREWHEPAQVFGQDVQQVLITTVLIPITVHPCRLRLINQNSKSPQDVLTPPYILNKNDKHHPEPHNKIRKNQHHLNIENSDSEDEDPSTRKSANHHSSN